MRIFLANPPWCDGDQYGVRAGSRWPHLEDPKSRYMPFPFFLAYATAVLEQNGYAPRLVDAVAERITLPVFHHKIERSDPDLIILEVSTPSFISDMKVAATIRQRMGKSVKIGLCGPNDLMTNRDFLENNPEIDYILKGEYEITLLELVTALDSKNEPDQVSGLIYRNDDGCVIENEDRPLFRDIDALPWPSRHQLPMMTYYDEAGSIVEPGVQMWASRGCPHMCIFCVWPQLVYGGSNYRVRNPVDVVDEMQWLKETYGFKSVYFDDDTFNIGKQRMLKICDEIQKRQLDLPWSIMARADCMDREILEQMKRAGMQSVKYGVETGDQTVLDNSGKKLDLGKVKEVIAITRELDINYHLTFTFGLPGETWESARKTIDMALELDPHTVQFSICTPMPGSKYFEMARNKGYLADVDWQNYTGFSKAVIRTESLSFQDLEEILVEANEKWAAHKHQIKPVTWKTKTADTIRTTGKKILKNLLDD